MGLCALSVFVFCLNMNECTEEKHLSQPSVCLTSFFICANLISGASKDCLCKKTNPVNARMEFIERNDGHAQVRQRTGVWLFPFSSFFQMIWTVGGTPVREGVCGTSSRCHVHFDSLPLYESVVH